MSFPSSLPVTGALFGFRRIIENGWLSRPEMAIEPSPIKGWTTISLTSSSPLLGEAGGGVDTFRYFFLLRESGKHLLLLGEHLSLVETFIAKFGLREYSFCPAVEIQRLVKSLVECPSSYVMSAVYARVQGFGQSLRSISLYGSDVGDARLFRDIIEGLQPYRVTLRKVETGEEVISIGSRGETSFHYNGPKCLREVDRALQFLAKEKYIDWNKQLSFLTR